MPIPGRLEELSGWGRCPRSVATVVEPLDGNEVARAVSTAPPTGVIARGLGRAYGDPAQCAGGRVISTRRLATMTIDGNTITAGGGTTLDDLLDVMVPRGLFIPVTPGTRRVTLGGMIAADVHGKNHHHAGSFGAHVTSIALRTATGELRTLTPHDELFWATVGGMGMTGVIESATFTATEIATSRLLVDTVRTDDLDGVLAEMVERDHLYDYSVAWLDLTARGRHLGRSVLTRGRFAQRAELPAKWATQPYHYRPLALATMPPLIPSQALNTATAAAFNTAWYLKSPKNRTDEVQSIGAFFHPLDGVKEWNRAYGPRGFLQWQFVVPDDRDDVLRRSIAALVDAGCLSFLTVLKRFGPGGRGLLSFPMGGWTLTVDVPSRAEFSGLLHRLDRDIVECGGRLYLAKDSRMDPSLLPRMYDQLDRFRGLCDEVDPQRRFASDLSRRLNLRG